MDKLFQYRIDHLLFWLLTIFFHAFTRTFLWELAGADQFFLEILIRNALLALVVYTNLLIIIPRFFDKKKYGIGFFLVLLSMAFYVLLKNVHDEYLQQHFSISIDSNYYKFTLYNFSIIVFYLVFSTTLHFSKQWYLQQELIRKIELEKLNTELEYLKAQINPHFLFNSLNTVFFQIDKQNAQARETLAKFSDMLRYQLYECNGKEIAIEKEITYLKNYVELQRLRKDENYSISFTSSDNLVNFSIPPLLLLPFIENAFKHVSHFNDRKNQIDIDLRKTDHHFQVRVSNTKDLKATRVNGGIGLSNVKRRLELLYHDRFMLNITEEPEHFNVHLTLELTG